MALIVQFDNLTAVLDKENCAIDIFLDFQKVFDTVNHSILLNKLYIYGIHGIAHEWFINYLSNRTQSVNYLECFSDSRTLKLGVPQGSILGPLVVLAYISHLPSVSTLFMPILFLQMIQTCFALDKPWWFGTENKYRNGKDLFPG